VLLQSKIKRKADRLAHTGSGTLSVNESQNLLFITTY